MRAERQSPPLAVGGKRVDSRTFLSWRLLAVVSAAILLPPVVPALALPYLTPFVLPPAYPAYDPAEIPFFYVAALCAGIAFGLPPFLVLRWLKLASWWSAGPVGAGIGGGIAYAFGGWGHLNLAVASWAFTGFLAGLVFWFVASSGPRASQTP